MLKPIPTYSAEIDESTGGISIMSLVDRPAVEALFVKFSEETRIALAADTERQVVTGVAMIPDFPIYRRDNLTGEYYVTFSKDAIMRAVEVFFRDGHTTSPKRTSASFSKVTLSTTLAASCLPSSANTPTARG